MKKLRAWYVRKRLWSKILWAFGSFVAALFVLVVVLSIVDPVPDESTDTAAATTPTASPPAPMTTHSATHRATHSPTTSTTHTATQTPTPKDTPKASSTSAAPAKPARTPTKTHRHHTYLWPVIRVVDGDTVHVRYKGRDTDVRLIGINTPETVDPNKSVECGGPAASARAHQVLDGKKVRLVFDASQGRHDKYGRTLGYLEIPGVGDYGHYMIKHGFAFEYTYDTAYRRQASYRSAQSYARAHNLWPVWSKCGGKLEPLHTSKPTPAKTTHTSTSAPPPAAPAGNCTPGYSPCIPPAEDWDCSQLKAKGLAPVHVTGSDPYRLDEDGDGWGCE